MKFKKLLLGIIVIAHVAAVLMVTGCVRGTLAPDGVYKSDKALYTADKTITGAYDTLHAFVKWEHDNRAAVAQWPEITRAADFTRDNAERWVDSASALRDAYAANPTQENESALMKSLAVLRAALSEATIYLEQK